MSWAVCSLARATKTDKNLAVRTYVQNKPHTEKPRKSSYPLPKKKNFDRPPRELQCSDRAQTSTTGSGRPSCVDIYSFRVLAKSARTKRQVPKQTKKNHKNTYTYDFWFYFSSWGILPFFQSRVLFLPAVFFHSRIVGACPVVTTSRASISCCAVARAQHLGQNSHFAGNATRDFWCIPLFAVGDFLLLRVFFRRRSF